MKIAIIGAGVVGKAVGYKLMEVEHAVREIGSSLFCIDYFDVGESASADYDLYVICTPEQVIDEVLAKLPFDAKVIIKSTVPLGYTARVGRPNVCFIPEFLREASALTDVMNPWRLIIEPNAREHIELFRGPDTKIVYVDSSTEAEAIKLLSNAYLASRVVFFNEVDQLAIKWGLHTTKLIDGICADPRIGNGYNKISAGYGGKCLPKDVDHLIDATDSEYFKQVKKSNGDRKWFAYVNKYLIHDMDMLIHASGSRYFQQIQKSNSEAIDGKK